MNSVRLEPDMEEKIRKIAALKGLTLSEVHRLALNQYCDREAVPVQTSRYDDIIGVGEGASDLSARAGQVFGEIMEEKHDRHSH